MEHSPGSALVDRTRGRAVARRSPSALPALPRRADPGSIGSVIIPVPDGPVQLAVRSGRDGRGARRGKPRCDSPPVCGRAGTVLCRVAGCRREWSVRRREWGARCVCRVVHGEEEANEKPVERRGLRPRSDADSAWSAVVPSREHWQASAVWRTRRSIASGMSVRPSWLTVQSGSTSGSSNRRAAESKVTRDVQPQCRESGTPDETISRSPVRAVAVAPASMRSADRGTEQTGTCWPAAALPGVFPGAKDDICPIRAPRGDARCRLLGARATRPMPRP
jgi:hypothetical protein